MARSFTVSFNINGAMDGSLQAALNAAANAMRGLGNAARAASASAAASRAGLAGMAAGLNQLQAAAQRYKQVQDALKQSTADFAKAGQNLAAAKAKYEADAAAAEKLKQKLQELKAAQASAADKKAVQSNGLKIARQDLANLKRAYELAKRAGDQQKMVSLDAQIKSTQAAVTKQQEVVKKAAQAYRELSEQVKQTKAALTEANAAAQKSGSDLSAARSNTQRLSQNFQSQLAALNQIKAQLSAAGFSTSGFAAAESRLAGDIDRVNAALQRQQALMNAQNASNQAAQNMFNAYNGFQNAINTAQQIASPFTAAAETAIDFEHSMSRVKALTQSQNIREGNMAQVKADMDLLTAQARELGATTMFTSKQAADAMGYLGMAGWKTQQIYGTMPGMLNLAAAAGADLAQTADIVSDNMTAMGVPVDKASHFMDVYAYALTNSNARLTDFGETMKYAAPVAKSYGATLDETAAMVMMMANAGIKGSMAGTSLRMGLLRLAGPPKTATKEMEKLGLSLSDAQAGALEAEAVIKGLGIDLSGATTAGDKMTRVLMQLHDKTKNLSQDEKLAAFKGIFGVNAETGWLALFDQGPEVFMKYVEGLKAADGYSAQVAETMNDDTRGALIRLESAWDAFKERVGEALTPAIRSVAESFAPLVTAAANFVAANPAIVQAAASIAAALASIVVGAAAVKLAFAGWTFITSSITMVRAALATLADGALLGGLIGRLAALRAAFVGAFAAGGLATTGGWATLFAGISAKATAAAAAIRGFFASLTLGSMASGIAATISSIGTAIAGAARAAMSFAFSPVGVALMALALAGLYVYQNWEKVSGVFSNIAGIITGSLSPALAQVKAALNAFSSSGGFAALSNAASQAASVVGGTLVKAFAVLLTVAASTVAMIIQLLADLVTIIADIGTGFSEAFAKIAEGDFSGAFDALKSAGSKAFDDLKQLGTHVFDGVEQGAKNVQAVIDALNSSATTSIAAAQNTGSGMATGLLAAAQAPQPAAVPETQPIDTSATQAALDQVGDSASNAATQMQGIEQATAGVDQMAAQFAAAGTGVEQLSTSAQTAGAGVQQFSAVTQQAGTGVQQFSTNAQQAGTSAQQLATSAQNAAAGTDALGNSAQNATGGIEALSASAAGAVGGVSNLGSAAASAAGSVSGLGAAVQAACSQLASAGASAAAAVASAAPKANYKGGIYPKGQFLTTFAEKSPEAAIPIDNSKRARELWTKTGQMLGMLPGNGGGYDSAEKDALGNIVGMDIPEYNRIGEGDSEDVKIDKRRVQREQYESERLNKKIVQQAAARQVAANQTAIQRQALEITRTARENYIRQRLGGRRVPTAASERRLSQAEHNRQLREQVLSGQKSIDAAINEVKLPSGATIGDALKRLPESRGILSQDNYPNTRGNVPTITTPPFAPTGKRKSSGVSLVDIAQSIPGFKGNIGGFDILGGLTGGNIFGSFGALDGKFGGLLNKLGRLGSVGNFGALGDLGGGLMHVNGIGEIDGLDDLPILNSRSASNSAPPEFNVTINVTVNGKADENAAQNIAQQTVSAFNDWADNYFAFQHDAARRSFA